MQDVLSFLGHPLFINLVIGGFAAATGLVSYLARQIINNQKDLQLNQSKIKDHITKAEMKFDFMSKQITKESTELLKTKEEVGELKSQVNMELARLKALTDIFVKQKQ